MNLFSPLLKLFNKGTLSNPDRGYQNGAVERTSTSSGVDVTDERALKLSVVWACVQLIANAVASTPVRFFKKTDDGRDEITQKHPLVDLFHKSPNSLMKPRDFRLAMTVQMALWNNAYAEIIYSGNRPVALMPLRPGRMAPFIDKDGVLTYHYHVDFGDERSNNGIRIYSKKSILHLKGFGTDGVVGAERNNFARESYGLAVSAETYAAKQFANGGRPGGVLQFDQFLTKEQRAQVADMYEGISKGAINANRLWILEGGSDYKALDFTADQMQMIATRNLQVSDIARFFGVPEPMISASMNASASWPASFEQQQLAFLKYTINPYFDEWEAAIKDALVVDPTVVADHDASNFVKLDTKAKAEFLSSLVQNGLMTRNEARAQLSLDTVSGGDELTAQINLTTIDKLGEDAPEPEPEPSFEERMDTVVQKFGPLYSNSGS